MSEEYKKALRIAVNVGCGFEGDAEDAAELLTLITGLESRIAEFSQAVGLITTLKPTMVMDANHPLDMAKEVAEYVTARIAQLEAELKITDELLKEATETIGAVVACCTYNSNDDAKIGIYGIDQKAFTRIDQFITHYNDAVSAGKVSVDVKTSTDNNKGE